MTSQRNSLQPKLAAAVSLLLFGIGAALCIVFLTRMSLWSVFTVTLSLLVALRYIVNRAAVRGASISPGTWVHFGAYTIARIVLLAFDLFALYLAIAWGSILWWTISWWIGLVISALVAACLLGRVAPRTIPRVPLVLPLGVWIIACLLGWLREESFVRCDDYSRLAAPVSMLMPTTTEVARCRPGERLPIGRYARKFWQSPDGRRLRFTTQAGGRSSGRLDGLICELDLSNPSGGPRCVGGAIGKGHAITSAEAIGKVLVAAWSLPPDAQGRTSAIFVLPEQGPITIEAEHRFDGSVADLIFEPRTRTLLTFFDSNDRIRSVKLPEFSVQPDVMAPVFPAEVRYDPTHDEGVVCGLLAGVAIRGNPLSYRFFGKQSPTLWSLLGLSWGCDWNPSTRRVYATVPNLGLVYEIDYDSGQILRRHWVGFGARSATLDPGRAVVYVTNFLSGHVIALDITTGEERARWFVGHFIREAYLSRDRNSLFVGSNLGVVRIALGARDG